MTSFRTVPTALPVAKTSIVILPVGKNSRGFTLVELITVLLLISVSMAIVIPNISKGLQEREVRSSALGLAAVARDLRSRALSDGVPQQLLVNLPENSYLVARTREVRLPTDVKFVSVNGGESVDRDTKRFYFFPNGSSLGGDIVLADNDKGISYLIHMEPLTGRIEVSRGNQS
jgi:prepilin-type N-terminal cleavage/methylation domain-containing protein